MYDIGDTVPLTVTIRNAAGTPVNPTTIALTITLPDLTTTSPSITNPPSVTGVFPYDYVSVQPGLHQVRWTSTVPATSYTDVFNAWPAAGIVFVGLTEVKDQLNIGQADTTHDEELRRAIAGACAVVEDIVGVVARRSFVQTFSGRGLRSLLLSRRPVIAVTSIVEDSATLAAADYSVTEHGVLTRVGAVWPTGVGNIVVTHTAGRVVVGDNILDGTRDLIRVNFRPQLGGNRSPYDTAGPQQSEAGQVRLGFFIPNSVMERLHGSSRGPHIA